MDAMRSLLLIGALALGIMSSATPAHAAGVHMFVRHEVTDYATWRKSYDAFGATQKDMGVSFQAVYQSTDDPNDVTVVHDFKSLEKAKAFVTSDKLKAAMQQSGVKGAPTIWYTTMTSGTSGKPGHVRMFVRHEVADYATWHKSYDAFAATQKKLGVTAQAVYQSTDNPNDVTATHDFASVEKAKAFAASPELKSAMEGAGVKGAPQIWFTTRAAK
jgi:quinol monooxygenase YgiN